MDKASVFETIVDRYNEGHRHFINLDFDTGENVTGLKLTNATFENCCFSMDFSNCDLSNTRFWDCNLKCSDFSKCDLTLAVFDKCLLDATKFTNAIIHKTVFNNCYAHGQKVFVNSSTTEVELFKTPLIKELYDNVPSFDKVSDHQDDELNYVVFGNLSLLLFEDIGKNDEVTEFAKDCFSFFNLIGDRNDNEIDNLLVVGVYEGLYSNKKCNDTARQLLKGRNKEVYEYAMKNGNIRADY